MQFLVHCWSLKLMQKAGGDGGQAAAEILSAGIMGDDSIERFLVDYICDRRLPLSVVSAILSAIDDEIQKQAEAERYLTAPRSRFQSLHSRLLDEFQTHRFVMKKSAGISLATGTLLPKIVLPVVRFMGRIPVHTLHYLLNPASGDNPQSINEVSPIQV